MADRPDPPSDADAAPTGAASAAAAPPRQLEIVLTGEARPRVPLGPILPAEPAADKPAGATEPHGTRRGGALPFSRRRLLGTRIAAAPEPPTPPATANGAAPAAAPTDGVLRSEPSPSGPPVRPGVMHPEPRPTTGPLIEDAEFVPVAEEAPAAAAPVATPPKRRLWHPFVRTRRAPEVAPDRPLLAVDELTVTFDTPTGRHPAVDRVSFTLARGEILGVVGESGAGKTVLGAALTDLVGGTSRIAGSITLDGERIDGLSERRLRRVRGRRIGTVFQDPLTSLNPLLSIGRQLVETIRAHHRMSRAAATRRAAELLASVGIADPGRRLRAYPHQFSGGMRQRVVIALALAADPVLVVADEPTTALDVSVQAQVIATLKRMCRERGAAVLLITHDMALVAEMADRIAVMYAGRIVETGPTAAVIAAPQHPYTQGLMAAIPRLDADAAPAPIPGAMPRLGTAPPGCPFSLRCPEAWARCVIEQPAMYAAGGSLAACFLHEPAPEPPPPPTPAAPVAADA